MHSGPGLYPLLQAATQVLAPPTQGLRAFCPKASTSQYIKGLPVEIRMAWKLCRGPIYITHKSI